MDGWLASRKLIIWRQILRLFVCLFVRSSFVNTDFRFKTTIFEEIVPIISSSTAYKLLYRYWAADPKCINFIPWLSFSH